MSKKLIAALVLLTLGLAFCGIGWRLNRIDLEASNLKLLVLENQLANTHNELEQVRADLAGTLNELGYTYNYLTEVETGLKSTNEELLITREELIETRERLSIVKSERLRLYNPTLKETIQFLAEDKTDSNPYVEDEYVCSHFAADVNNNAEKMGIRCAFVDVRFPASGHAIVAFDTADEGIVFFDPITDDRVRPVIGREYWQCVEPKPGYYYEKPTFDDTITDIVIVW
ncbi:MAG: hypothetical protein PHI12_12070 [Dehalococcoidales bacterium]|nr:hypothetical protein [Dehalococcoidales bacterium]